MIKRYKRSISKRDGDRAASDICSGSVEPSCVSIFKLYFYEYINLLSFLEGRMCKINITKARQVCLYYVSGNKCR